MWPGEVVGVYLWDSRNMRQTENGHFNPGSSNDRYNHYSDSDEDGRSNPYAKATVMRVVHRRVRSIKRNHTSPQVFGLAETWTMGGAEDCRTKLTKMFAANAVTAPNSTTAETGKPFQAQEA